MQGKIDVVGIGNALIDLTYSVEESFLKKVGIKKGTQKLVDDSELENILEILENQTPKISCGGSVANTISGINLLGGKTCFMGEVGNDFYGSEFIRQMKNEGTEVLIARDLDKRTGSAITFITPDKERSFATYLGAASEFDVTNVNEEGIMNSKILHTEIYQFQVPLTREAIFYASSVAKDGETKVSLDLSDPRLVKKIPRLEKFVKEYVNIIFANEDEAESFTGKKGKSALEKLSKYCETAVLKLGGKGSLVKHLGETFKIKSVKTKVVDLNGAGDMYAGAFLYGLTNNRSILEAGNLASEYAAKVVAKEGARLNNILSQ